ncbi:AraC family transcriptional regulator [Paenibacillus radicis (ex Xue et al. 2023)]|uniref:AraC family transcriptional regulator n=1 Tax=Paenibacillus radicis (ex Xue et al. 2023) TaxID=2972489 RepID=A0ABT1YBA4_9BACL|nr:AraC family transcriptional regulator [Paenibacillus radicis (ex Xue et al. 2023)]MCR8630035.1 AraC family transcriptional regulator [Paenibacillus radicis (ex Xue et al. 2023)]
MNRWTFSFPLRENKLFFKILAYFLSLLIPIVVIGIVFYFQFYHAQRNQLNEKIASTLKTSVSTIDTNLHTAQKAGISLFYDPTIQRIMLPEDLYAWSNRAELPLISKIIANYSNIAIEYIVNMFVMIDKEKVFTAGGIEDFSLFFNKTYQYAEYPKEFWEKRLETTHRQFEILPPTFVSTNKRKVVPFITVNHVGSHQANLVINIPLDMIERILVNNAIFTTSRFAVIDGQQNIILNGSPELISEDVISALFQEAKEGRKTSEIHIANQLYVMNIDKSDRYGWYYFAITPESEFRLLAGRIFSLIISICIVLAAIGIAFSFIFSKNLYTPIKRIRDILEHNPNGNDTADSIETVRNEMDFINHGVRQLLENNMAFQNQLKRNSEEFLDQSIYQLLTGNVPSDGEYTNHPIAEMFKGAAGGYVCCNFKFTFKELFYDEIQDVDRLIIISKLKNLIAGLMNGFLPTYVIEYKPRLYVAVVKMEEKDEDQLRKALSIVLHTFEYDFRYCSVRIGIGKRYDQLEAMHKTFYEAMTMLDQDVNSEETGILDITGRQIHHKYFYPASEENKLINFLKLRDLDQAVRLIEETVQNNIEKGISHPFLALLLEEIYHTCLRFAFESGIEMDRLMEEDYGSLIHRRNTSIDLQEKKELLFLFVARLVEITAVRNENNPGHLITMVLQYIGAGYQHDLYLEKIAGDMGISAKYLSRIFKEKTGINITDYIQQLRITRAKELLETTRSNVSDIAAEIGIYNRTTFIRLFKKYEGVTPVEYRKAKSIAKPKNDE